MTWSALVDVMMPADRGPATFDVALVPSGADSPTSDPSSDPTAASAAEASSSRRSRRPVVVGSVVVGLLVAVTVTSLGWNSELGRADGLAARLSATRSDLRARDLEVSNLRKEVSNLQEGKKVLSTYIDELESEQDSLRLDNEGLSDLNETISSVVRELDQCLTDTDELGRQLMRNPQAVPEDRIRRALAQCAAAQAAAKVLKATTKPSATDAV